MNKYLEALLLSDNENNLKKIDNLLLEDYKQTLREIFVVLLNNIKTAAFEDINRIMTNIELIISKQEPENYKIIINAVKEANYKLEEINKNNLNNRDIKFIKFRLIDLNRQILCKKENDDNNNLYNFYKYLIFEEKNIDIIKILLKNDKNVLSKKDEDGRNLFYNIIDYYCSLNKEDEDERNYFYEVIITFLESEEEKILRNEKESYLELLNRNFCKNKHHVQELIARFQNLYLINLSSLGKKFNISTKVHETLLKELKEFKTNIYGRTINNSNFITIDGEDALCLDDALNVKQNKNGSYTLHVAIIDIPSYIKYESQNYYFAMKNSETIYLCDDTISMFPDEIANNYCSLLPNTIKNVIIYKFLVDTNYDVDIDSLEIIKGIIKINKRLSYKEVNKLENLDKETLKMLEVMSLIAMKLKSKNSVKEKYRKIENIINPNFNNNSMFTDVSIADNIVQEAMLLTNRGNARYFSKNSLIHIFRNMTIKGEEEVIKEADRLVTSSLSKSMDQAEYKKLLCILKEAYLGAYYSTKNLGHQGLGYEAYGHSTSPARRFSDTYNQYLTYEQVFNKNISDQRYYELEEETNEIVKHINEKKKEIAKFTSEYNYLNSKKMIRKRQ